VVVALVLALTVPVSQLRTVTVAQSCCCPDPTRCHCPDHEPSKPGQPELRACHQATHVLVAPTLPAFAAPVVAMITAPAMRAAAPVLELVSPHAAPTPARPDAPS